jgi:hypothetical protein
MKKTKEIVGSYIIFTMLIKLFKTFFCVSYVLYTTNDHQIDRH